MSFLNSEFARIRQRMMARDGHCDHELDTQSLQSAALAAAIYDARRERDSFFPEGLFADPAWDILLDLYVARCLGKPISVSSACIGASVPATTGLRWLDRLVGLGFVRRSPVGGKSITVDLTEDALRRMTDLLAVMGAQAECVQGLSEPQGTGSATPRLAA